MKPVGKIVKLLLQRKRKLLFFINILYPSPQLIQHMTIDNISFKRVLLHKFWCMICVCIQNIYGIFGTLKM